MKKAGSRQGITYIDIFKEAKASHSIWQVSQIQMKLLWIPAQYFSIIM